MDGKFLWILFNFQQHRCRCGLEHDANQMIYDFYIASRLNVSHHSSAEGDCVEEILVLLLLRLYVSYQPPAVDDCIEELLVWFLLCLDLTHPSSAAVNCIEEVLV